MKIATLLPSATEIVCALGLRDQLVAVSHECDYPAGVEGLPHITSSIIPDKLSPAQIDTAVVEAVQSGQALYQVNGDMLDELRPDLIVTQGICDVCAVNLGTVEESLLFLPDVVAADVALVTLSGKTFAGVLRDIRQVAAAAGVADVGARLVADLREDWARLGEKRPFSQPQSRPKTLLLEWPEPFFYGGHWVPEMIEQAGGVDVIGQVGVDSGRCTVDDVMAQNPDVIVSIACGYGLAQNGVFADQLLANSALQGVRAVQSGNVWAVDANSYFSRPGPRLVRGVELLQTIFAGQGDAESEVMRAKKKE